MSSIPYGCQDHSLPYLMGNIFLIRTFLVMPFEYPGLKMAQNTVIWYHTFCDFSFFFLPGGRVGGSLGWPLQVPTRPVAGEPAHRWALLTYVCPGSRGRKFAQLARTTRWTTTSSLKFDAERAILNFVIQRGCLFHATAIWSLNSYRVNLRW